MFTSIVFRYVIVMESMCFLCVFYVKKRTPFEVLSYYRIDREIIVSY